MTGAHPRGSTGAVSVTNPHPAVTVDPALACRMFGHRYRFTADGKTMRWSCQRGCGATGTKVCATESAAATYAARLAHVDTAESGRRAPSLGRFPLRVWRARHGHDRHGHARHRHHG